LTYIIADERHCEEAILYQRRKNESAMAKLFYRKTRRGGSMRRRARAVSPVDAITAPDSAAPRTENASGQEVVDMTPDALAARREAESIEQQKEEPTGSQQQP
jgi:hypothetical protein